MVLERMRGGVATGLVGLLALLGTACGGVESNSGAQLFDSPQTNPVVLNENRNRLAVANTTSGTVSIFDTDVIHDPEQDHGLLAEIHVGLDPVGLAFRPGATRDEDELLYVTNYISDNVTVVSLASLSVVDTIQELDADGVTRTDAPVGIEFVNRDRALVTLDDTNEVLVLDFVGDEASITQRIPITAQAPRAVAVDRELDLVYVAAFESGNQTEFPSCAPGDPRGLDENDPHDEGCEFTEEIIESLTVDVVSLDPVDIDFQLELGTIFDFAAVNPNIGGRVIFDRDLPDRDLFVFRGSDMSPVAVLEGMGTLLYGLAAHEGKVWLTNTDARNHLEGLTALDNRMFDNRLAYTTCTQAGCGATTQVDLEANPFGLPVPTPYGVAASRTGENLVISVAGSDGIPGIGADAGKSIPGLIVTDAVGNVIGQVATGAIPQGVALDSGKSGTLHRAFVLNTVDSTLSLVDLSEPAQPTVATTFPVGSDPTPPEIREGRTIFMSARASTKGTFSCESCHPNANIDQILWVINTNEGPNDVPGCDPFAENCPEPRTTMPIRGLRDTLPLHWVGNLGDPFPDLPGQLPQPEALGAPDCDLAVDGEVGCARDLSNASLSGVMCEQPCAVGPTGLPGLLTDAERDALAAFMMSVSFPPSPKRRPDDVLSPVAMQGVSDFFTDLDGLGVGSPNSGGVGQAVGFAPVTCADNTGGCHALPLTASTNSRTVGGFDAPSMRGIWDRFILFSNGNVSSEEWLEVAQDCADGNPPGDHPDVTLLLGGFPQSVPGLLVGDPCALNSPLLSGDGNGGLPPIPLPGITSLLLDPFPGQPSGEEIYDPAVGMTERGQFMGSFEAIFHLAYGVRGAPMWEFFSEMSVGLPGLTGRQVSFAPGETGDPALTAFLDLLEQMAQEGRVEAVLRNPVLGEYRFHGGLWMPTHPGESYNRMALLTVADETEAITTVTAELRAGISIGGLDRQPLLDIDPDLRALEMDNQIPPLPLPIFDPSGGTERLGALYVDPAAQVLVDGVLCGGCGLALTTSSGGVPAMDLTLLGPLAEGVHVVQVLNPDGWQSNEMPILVQGPVALPVAVTGPVDPGLPGVGTGPRP